MGAPVSATRCLTPGGCSPAFCRPLPTGRCPPVPTLQPPPPQTASALLSPESCSFIPARPAHSSVRPSQAFPFRLLQLCFEALRLVILFCDQVLRIVKPLFLSSFNPARLLAATKTILPVSPCLSCFNTEHTERLSDLCVEALLTKERAETLRTRGGIFAAREDADYWWQSAPHARNSTRLVGPGLAPIGVNLRKAVARPVPA